jgi:hypothetical protein
MLNRLRSTVRSLGWSDTLTYILAVLIARLTRHRGRLLKYYFVAQPVPPATSPVSGTSGSTHFYRADAPDAVIGQAARPESVIRQRFEQRAHCIVAGVHMAVSTTVPRRRGAMRVPLDPSGIGHVGL